MSTMVTNRIQKFDKLVLKILAKELNEMFAGEIFSLTMVHVSKDLSFAKVWVSAINKPDELIKEFNNRAIDLRKILSKEITARKVPKLYFVVDGTEDKAAKIDQIIASLDIKD